MGGLVVDHPAAGIVDPIGQSNGPGFREPPPPSRVRSGPTTIDGQPRRTSPPHWNGAHLRRSRASRASTSLATGDGAVAGTVAGHSRSADPSFAAAPCCWSARPIGRPPAFTVHRPDHLCPVRWLRPQPRSGWPAAGAVCRRGLRIEAHGLSPPGVSWVQGPHHRSRR